MAAVINTNYLSMVAQNNLNKSQSALGSAIERLSSGLRINSAKDDAAGQAIANRFTANIKGLTQAARNANDGISIAQTTEGALNEINNNLQRVRQLSVQATSGTNSPTDLDSIQAEIKQRLDEIDRVSAQTQFNGVNVLAKDNKLTIQVGANDGETITIDLKEVTAKTLGLDGFNVSGPRGTQATDATESSNLKAKGFDVASGASGSYYIAVNPKDADTTTAAGTAAFKLKTDSIPLTSLNKGATANPLAGLDKALQDIDSQRSSLGAIQNRFESTVANLNNTINNLSAARSRIEDADYATEVSNMTKAQILQQAGTSVLAQANQVPQTVLSLLR